MSSFDTVSDVAHKLARLHKPIIIDYKKRFGLTEKIVPSRIDNISIKPSKNIRAQEIGKQYFCIKCNKAVSEKVATYCL